MANEENGEVEHKCPTIGEKLQTLEDSLVLQFRTATPEQAAALSESIHRLKILVGKLCTKHDVCFDMAERGEFGWKRPEKFARIRQERADKKSKKADDFSSLDF